MLIDYSAILGIPRKERETLILDFSGVEFLDTCEITELFYYCMQIEEFTSLEIRNASAASDYLERVNFFAQIARLRKFSKITRSVHTGMNDHLLELQVYSFKPEFYGDYERMLSIFQGFGLSPDTASLVVSSLAEIIDNAFSHNLGLWDERTGPLVTALMQDKPKKREVGVSICDFGVGFHRTLQNNYPELRTEADAVALSLRSNTTGRANKRGGNGLVYLQKNVFNGFAGDLFIRSTDTLMQITGREQATIVHSSLPFRSGANIFFRLRY